MENNNFLFSNRVIVVDDDGTTCLISLPFILYHPCHHPSLARTLVQSNRVRYIRIERAVGLLRRDWLFGRIWLVAILRPDPASGGGNIPASEEEGVGFDREEAVYTSSISPSSLPL